METRTRDGVAAQSIADIWTELRDHLERHSAELNAEIRAYPRPIARCDDQLPKLLEQRARAVRLLNAAIELDAARTASSGEVAWLDRLQGFLSGPDAATDDDIEAELRSRLSIALAGLR
jgi:hypothetical protein